MTRVVVAAAVCRRADRSHHLRRGDNRAGGGRGARVPRPGAARRRDRSDAGAARRLSVKWPRPCGLPGSPHTEARGSQLLADAESGGALGVSRAAVLLRLARRQGPLQADRPRRGVGRHPAADHHLRLHDSVRPLRRDVEIGGGALRAPRLRRDVAVDVLCQRGGGGGEQPHRQQPPDQQGLLSADPHSDCRHCGGAGRLRDRLRRPAR